MLIKKIKEFYLIWIQDILVYPYNYLMLKKRQKKIIPLVRKEKCGKTVFVEIHEWGGYNGKRIKKVNRLPQFEVGLNAQLDRFCNYRGMYSLDITVTISDIDRAQNLDSITKVSDRVFEVDNRGMDFSGYSKFYSFIKDKNNSYVILTNTSINSMKNDFLDSYIEYMECNKDVGMLGISCSSKYYHTLLRNNYNPHLQSFFILTTIEVLNNIVKKNKGIFPGKGIVNKHLLIREGEVLLSRLALLNGYNLAVVTDNGVVKFNYNSYPFPKGDLRLYVKLPNYINLIK